MQISDSTALLTGATGGIGHAIARELRGRGAKLVLTGRRTDLLEPLAAELDARALTVDLSAPAEVDRLVAETGEVDIFVANAALPASGRLETYTVEQLDRALDVNLRAPIVLAHALLPGMIERRRGHLLFMSSMSVKVATPGTAMYDAAKCGLRGFASALRADLRTTGVGVSVVFPSFVRDAGMFVEAGVGLPPGVGTRTPRDVARAVAEAIERDRAEVDVAALSTRLGVRFASLAPKPAASIARMLGSERIAQAMEAAQLDKR
ncbi:MAG: SDR family NAD(P)-dependent oxidoreductase [Solirubrobacteraceae bacterium]